MTNQPHGAVFGLITGLVVLVVLVVVVLNWEAIEWIARGWVK